MSHSHHEHSHHMMNHQAMPDMNMSVVHDGHMNHQSDSMNMDGMHDMMMHMSFFFDVESTVLFSFWHITTVGGLIGSMIAIFIMAAAYEGLKYYREYLFWKSYNSLQYRSVEIPAEKNVTRENNRVVQPSMFSTSHAIQTVLHIVQITLSYFLMLIFMTYNVWLCIPVVLGAAVGYFMFGWKKSVIVDVTEHCH